MVRDFAVSVKEGPYLLEGYVRCVGDDMIVSIWGGERPHIGAVAVAQPRPSLKDPKITSSTASVFCFLGHKEDELARGAALALAAGLGTKVVVTAGMHWDNLDQPGIEAIVSGTRTLVDEMLRKAKSFYSA